MRARASISMSPPSLTGSAPARSHWHRWSRSSVLGVMAAGRIHGDDTTVPLLAQGADHHRLDYGPTCVTTGHSPDRRLRPAVFFYSRNRAGEHPNQHLWLDMTGILQADAYAGFNELYAPARPNRDRSPRRPAGHTGVASSSSWPRLHRRTACRRGGAADRCHLRHRASAASTACRQSNASPCARSASQGRLVQALETWTCARRGAKCPRHADGRQSHGLHMLKRWDAPSVASSTTASASATMPLNARCAASRSEENRGCSRVRIAAANAPLPCSLIATR